jgi:hypothetical protein
MRMQLRRVVLLAALVLCLGLGYLRTTAQADEITGTWTGSVEGRGNYYWETSTRVVVPAIEVRVDSPSGLHLGAGYLVDVITSASIAQTGGGDDSSFTELRHGVNALVGQTFDLGSSQLDLTLTGVYSTESDYTSYVYGLESSLTFNEKDTRVSLSLSRVQDDVRSNVNPMLGGPLDGFTIGTGIEQVVNDVTVVSLSYQFGYLNGYLGNPYRSVLRPAPVAESPPDTRARHNVTARVAVALPHTSTAIHVLLSGYTDSWEVRALTPELQIYQQLGSDFILRPHYRFYAQTKAWFQASRAYPADWTGPTTNDPKLTEFTTHTLGLSAEYRLAFLGNSVLDFAKNSTLDLSFARYWSTNRFGNGIIATLGGRLLF